MAKVDETIFKGYLITAVHSYSGGNTGRDLGIDFYQVYYPTTKGNWCEGRTWRARFKGIEHAKSAIDTKIRTGRSPKIEKREPIVFVSEAGDCYTCAFSDQSVSCLECQDCGNWVNYYDENEEPLERASDKL